MLYEYSSSAANNGSGFEGLADNTYFWNITAGLAMLTGHGSSVTPYGVVMAGALISALPLLIVFFFVQKRFVEGIAMTGMK